MRQRGAVGWVTHDVTHRGVTAWILAGVLLAFYFGLYLTAETKRLVWALGVAHPVGPPANPADLAGDAVMQLGVPNAKLALVCAVVALLVTTPWSYFKLRNERFVLSASVKRAIAKMAGAAFALTAFTVYASLWFANRLEPVAHDGRHLLPSAGHTLPGWAVIASAVVTLGALGAVLARIVRHRGHPSKQVRLASLALAVASVELLVLLYGTTLLAPSGPAPADNEHSFRAFRYLLYEACDSKWTLYGLLYTLSVSVGGLYVIGKYLHNPYQVVRTLVVIFVQSTFAFSVPVILRMFAYPEYYLSYFWPLKIDAFYPDNILRDPAPIILWSFVGSLLFVPLMGVFFGKRWYCSWVCGCGGLANTAGEPFRHLSSKSESSWRFEKVAIYSVLALAIVTTLLVVLSAFVAEGARPTGVYWGGHGDVGASPFDPTVNTRIVHAAGRARYYYGIIVVAVLSGAIGVGLYPLGGTRQWCRNFCPMAALLGLIQKFGRYRIRVKKDMCISCGMCSKYCEMGIDVRAYAQANQTFTRASCVGCGMCAEVCPRGVLALESRWARDPQEKSAEPLVQIRLRR